VKILLKFLRHKQTENSKLIFNITEQLHKNCCEGSIRNNQYLHICYLFTRQQW